MSKGSSEVVSVSNLVDHLVEGGFATTKKGAAAVISTLFERITQEVESGKKVRIHGFGTFRMKHKPAHAARNPGTGEEVHVPAKDVLVFKAAKHNSESNDAE
ncbi:HU family DNA-binding protein [Acidithiobacillus sulfurivorans]|uniref:Integration host factor subunit beta n=1 Tax=Acidithiobacillus sulfurivorans TaxID=1958756 RepID=A0ABS6A1T7_9PROT|nr:HU family DNA-binding protein [Acidithiobacillus sulfurivorans]MBU2761166.1 integration host factor subunit beta [Acidithiobacillus sulfurivorans]